MSNEALKRTPLYDAHVKLGAKMVPFAGWEMPIQYGTGVIKEHMAVRTACGMFDVSHMGEIMITGSDALNNVNLLLTNYFSDLEDGQARYTAMCNDEGGMVDDLIVYKYDQESYLLVVNAANTDKDFKWISDHIIGKAKAKNISADVGQIALQGPKSRAVLSKLIPLQELPKKYYCCVFEKEIAGVECMISTTGYTGEDGVEIYMPADDAPKVWYALLDAGKDEGLVPCGLGARDTLRLEAGMPLYGHEMDETVSPLECGLGHFVDLNKTRFIGQAALVEKGTPAQVRTGLKVVGRGIIREHMDVYRGERKIGMTTSGTKGPFVNEAIGMARIDAIEKKLGGIVQVDVRGKRVDCEITKAQFYKRAK